MFEFLHQIFHAAQEALPQAPAPAEVPQQNKLPIKKSVRHFEVPFTLGFVSKFGNIVKGEGGGSPCTFPK